MRTCSSCGYENADDARFCSQCATPLEGASATREERKVVTCLFCDLVGFTARAESMDPEDVRRLLQPYHARVRSELERFGGTVEKFIGDAVMAVFGAPVTHEDDPERAVRSALAIRKWANEEGIELRIGVNSGEALVTVGGEPLAAGDVVNTAARLQAAAPSGGILVGEITYRATRDAIAYGEHEPVAAKGKAERVPVWVAEQAKARVKVEREARTPLVGRRRELSLLRDTLERAHTERQPQLVTLVGVPGIGKSRLVYELFKTIEERPDLVYWRHGRSLPYGEGVTFWALSEIVKAQAGILETDDPERVRFKLHAAVEAVAGDEDPRWLEGNLCPLVGLEALVVEGRAPDELLETVQGLIAARLELAHRAAHSARPPAIDLAWAADQLENAGEVRTWTESIAYRSLWTDAALAILDGDLVRAADLFSQIGTLPDEAYARLRAAERHANDGRRAEADEQLQQSLAFWRSVGATRYIREAEALLDDASEVPA